ATHAWPRMTQPRPRIRFPVLPLSAIAAALDSPARRRATVMNARRFTAQSLPWSDIGRIAHPTTVVTAALRDFSSSYVISGAGASQPIAAQRPRMSGAPESYRSVPLNRRARSRPALLLRSYPLYEHAVCFRRRCESLSYAGRYCYTGKNWGIVLR